VNRSQIFCPPYRTGRLSDTKKKKVRGEKGNAKTYFEIEVDDRGAVGKEDVTTTIARRGGFLLLNLSGVKIQGNPCLTVIEGESTSWLWPICP